MSDNQSTQQESSIPLVSKSYPRFKDPSKVQHGTKSGYDYHRRQMKEEPCLACLMALREYHRKDYSLRKDEINANTRARRAKNRIPNKINWYKNHLDELTELYGTDCHICGTAIDMSAPRATGQPGWERSYHPDHVIPLSKGGLDIIDNIRPSHAQCNMRKWATGAFSGKPTESELLEASNPSNP
jgi:5-methylcytosine-specific restriction endonuclease McrA